MTTTIRYQEYRDTMQDGDILLYQGNNFSSKVIQWRTKSLYTHAGIVVWWNERLMVLEAVGKGVIASPLSYNLKHYEGKVDYFRSNQYIASGDREKMVVFAQEQLGKKYGFGKIAEFFTKLMIDGKLEQFDSVEPKERYFCSEYVAQIYDVVGIDLASDRSESYTSPDLIETSPVLEIVGRLQPPT